MATVDVVTNPLKLLAAGAAGLALGNFPSADLAARAAHGDIRSSGTGNPGALNARNMLGKKWGVAVLAGDVGKGALAARVGGRLAGPTGANIASTAAVAGHCFPIGRSGGKGVATSIGQVAGTFPVYLPIDVGVAYGTTKLPFLRQRTRVATGVASLTWIAATVFWWRRRLANPGGVVPTAALPLAAVASSGLIAMRFAAEVEHVDAYNADLQAQAASL
jgi:glycerol-3-phosphate acyltransferase PlsY